MRNNFDTVLDECVELVGKGEADIETCLARYPEYSGDLRGFLETALALQDGGVPEPSHQTMDQGRERLLKAVAVRQLAQARSTGFFGKLFGGPALKWAGAMAGLAALLLVGGGVALASGDSLPGDALYPIKRGMEDVRLTLTPSDAGKASRHIALAENRAEELAVVASHATPERIEALSLDLNHNPTEAQRLAGSLTKGEEVAQIQERLERSAPINLGLLEGSLVSVPDESRAAFNDAFQLSSQGDAQAVETVAFQAPAPSLASLGFLQLRASDPPAPDLDNVFAELDKIEAYLAAGSESKWITIVDSPNTFDLLRVEQIHKFLGQQEIPAGTYTQIRFEIGQAVVVAEGQAYIAKVPSGKLTFGRPFTVSEGQTTVVTIDFEGQRSLHLNGEGDYILTPEVKLLVDEPLSDRDESSGYQHQASGKKMEIEGIIDRFSVTELVVGDMTINITPETEVEGTMVRGLYVDVEVVVEADGSFTAVEVEVKEERESGLTKVEFEGRITALGENTWTVGGYTGHLTGEATWEVGGQRVTVATHADIDGDPEVGYTVEVEGLLVGPNTLLALEIEVEDDDDDDKKDDRERVKEDDKGDGEEDGHGEERAHVELNGVIKGLYGAQGDIGSLSEQDLEGQYWAGDVTVKLFDGTSFIIGEETEIDGILRSGAEVEVEIETASDGTRYATEIEVEDHEEGKEDPSEPPEDREEEPVATADDGNKEEEADKNSESGSQQEEPTTAPEEGEELRYEGTLVSFGDSELVVLLDGVETSFIVDEETEIDGTPSAGVEVRVWAVNFDGNLIAVEVEF